MSLRYSLIHPSKTLRKISIDKSFGLADEKYLTYLYNGSSYATQVSPSASKEYSNAVDRLLGADQQWITVIGDIIAMRFKKLRKTFKGLDKEADQVGLERLIEGQSPLPSAKCP